MDAGRFDALSRSLKTNSRRGALRAIGVVGVAGLAERLGVTVAEPRGQAPAGQEEKQDRGVSRVRLPDPRHLPEPDLLHLQYPGRHRVSHLPRAGDRCAMQRPQRAARQQRRCGNVRPRLDDRL